MKNRDRNHYYRSFLIIVLSIAIPAFSVADAFALAPQTQFSKQNLDNWPPSWTPEGLSAQDIADGEEYHSVICDASWQEESISELVELALPYIKSGDVVIDYGTGTGGSAIALLKALDARGIKITLVCMDVLPSWFSKAYELLHKRSDVKFYSLWDPVARRIKPLHEVLGSRKANVIISASTLHLIPEKAVEQAMVGFSDVLVNGGALIWNSGDIDANRLPQSALLHDPFRMVREKIEKDPDYIQVLDRLSADDRARVLKEATNVFPKPKEPVFLTGALEKAGFSGRLVFKDILVKYPDAIRFILVQRLTKIASAVKDVELRRQLILRYIESVFLELRASGQTDNLGYHTYWTFGVYTKKSGSATLPAPVVLDLTMVFGKPRVGIATSP